MRLAVAAVLLVLTSGSALAHDWYIGQRDPVTGGSCCTTSANDMIGDCGQLIVTPTNMTSEDAGLWVHLTKEEAVKINPRVVKSNISVFIPWERVQPSHDGNFHICFGPTGTLYCFFMPPAG
jgi:hypothetical protein